jgi:hypothetical protein
MKISICGTKWIAALALLVVALVAGRLTAQDASVVYLEGAVNLKNTAGKLADLDFGSPVRNGESVITRRDSRADLELPNKSTISIKPNSVFVMGEVDVNGKKETVFSAPLGQVAFKFNKFAGNEPRIRSNSAIMGVRGTEFTVYSGMDGSSLLVVTQGAVELESAGRSVSLEPNEAVEVKPGEQPGQKFAWKGRELDFSAWNKGLEKGFMDNPLGSLERVEKQLAYFKHEHDTLYMMFNKNSEALQEVRNRYLAAVKEKGREEADKTHKPTLDKIASETTNIGLNIRYYTLSALSLRRFVMGKMYALVKAKYINELSNPAFNSFMGSFEKTLKNYETTFILSQVEADI